MLSVKSIPSGGNAGAVAAYYEGYQLGREGPDQKTHDEPAGRWCGSFAAARGFAGATVQRGDLQKAFSGHDPKTGEALARNAGPDHKPGHDLTFSAPKSVSAVWSSASPEIRAAISAAQQKSVESALRFAEQSGAFVQREGHAGAIKIPHHEIAAATFEHSSSRAGEPNLHTHAVVVNLSANGKRVDFDTRATHALGAFYRAEMAHHMQRLGYAVERDGKSFRLSAVPGDLEKDLSTRAAEIKAAAAKTGMNSPAARDIHALATRQAKAECPRETALAVGQAAAEKHDFDPEKIRSTDAIDRAPFDRDGFLDTAFREASTLSPQQLHAHALQAAQGVMRGDDALREIDRLEQSGELVRLRAADGEERWTSRETLEIERGLADFAERAAHTETGAKVSESALDAAIASRTLNNEQLVALRHITANHRNFAVVEGTAGTGKSYLMGAAREAWERGGNKVVGCALSGKAAAELETGAGIKSGTIHSTLKQIERGDLKLDRRTVIVCDEGGMVGSRLMARLKQHADAAGAKLVIAGDARQLQPIDNGGAMRSMRDSAGEHAALNKIMRQHHERDRELVHAIKGSRSGEALAIMQERGYLKEHADAAAARQALAERVVGDLADGKTSIALAGRHSDVSAVNAAARELARERGGIGEVDFSYTTKRDDDSPEKVKGFAVGDRVITLKNDESLNLKNGQTWTVTNARAGRLTLRQDETNREIRITEKQYKSLDHAYCATIHKSQGVTIDRAHALHDGSMTDRSLAYVAASRFRESMTYNYTKGQREGLEREIGRVRDKDSSADYKVDPRQRPGDKQQADRDGDRQPDRQPATPGNPAPRIDTRTRAEQRRDADLARRALDTGGKMPTPARVDKDVDSGKAKWEWDSKGEQYLSYKNGRCYHKDLHARAPREAQLRQAKTLGMTTKTAIVVDKHLIDFKIAGKRFQAVKTGTQVLVGRDTMMQKWAGKDRDELRERLKDPDRGRLSKAFARGQDRVYKDMNGEGWRKATTQEAVRTRISTALEGMKQRSEARDKLTEISKSTDKSADKSADKSRDSGFER